MGGSGGGSRLTRPPGSSGGGGGGGDCVRPARGHVKSASVTCGAPAESAAAARSPSDLRPRYWGRGGGSEGGRVACAETGQGGAGAVPGLMHSLVASGLGSALLGVCMKVSACPLLIAPRWYAGFGIDYCKHARDCSDSGVSLVKVYLCISSGGFSGCSRSIL